MAGRSAGRLILAAIAGAWLALPSAGIAQRDNDRASPGERRLDRSPGDDRMTERRKRAVERCKSQRGVDCDSPAGQREWLLQERTRREAVRDGSHPRPLQR